jgi:hypothetical protein
MRKVLKNHNNIKNILSKYIKFICNIYFIIIKYKKNYLFNRRIKKNKVVIFFELGNLGELGNQLFQIASTIGYAKKNNINFYFPKWVCIASGKVYSDYFNLSHKFFFEKKKINLKEFHEFNYTKLNYINIPFLEKNINLHGYFQSELYFLDYKKEIKKHFKPSKEVLKYIKSKYQYILKNTNYICVQIRTGTRSNCDSDLHNYANTSYLKHALSIYPINIMHVIFSDNIDYAKSILPSNRKYSFVNDENYIELFLMNYFKYYVLSASTFGWWGAWLSIYKDPEVTIMKDWFKQDNIKSIYNYNNISPEKWRKI